MEKNDKKSRITYLDPKIYVEQRAIILKIRTACMNKKVPPAKCCLGPSAWWFLCAVRYIPVYSLYQVNSS